MEKTPFTFLGLKDPMISESPDVVVWPLSMEQTVTWDRGTSRAPESILMSSRGLETFSQEGNFDLAELRIKTLSEHIPSLESPRRAVDEIITETRKILHLGFEDARPLLVTIGGEHTISAGILKGMCLSYPDIGVIHLDAHQDYYDSYNSAEYSHATVIRRISELNSVKKILSWGVRSFSEKHEWDVTHDMKISCLSKKAPEASSVKQLLSLHLAGCRNVYITIDSDVLDATQVSTGTPEMSGWSWAEMSDCVYATIDYCKTHDIKVIGFDIVEVIPNRTFDLMWAALIRNMIAKIMRPETF